MPDERSLKDVVDGLARLLVEEKTRLLAGQYDGLGALTAEKEKLAVRLDALLIDPRSAAQAPAFRRRLAQIVSLAKENEGLIAAAKSGVVSAQSRIKDIINRQRNIGVYGESGEKLLAPESGVTRRKLA